VEDLYIKENLDDQSINNISDPDHTKRAINSFKPFKNPGPERFFPANFNGD